MSRSMLVSAVVAGIVCWTQTAPAGEFVGIDPYGRAVYAPSGPFPIVPSRVRGPVYQPNPGRFGGPQVAGPLYYAEPAPPVAGYYRPDPAVAAGAILAFDPDAALGAANSYGTTTARCVARYNTHDAVSGAAVSNSRARRFCR